MKSQSLIPNFKSLAIVVAFFAVFAFAGPVSHFGMLKACKVNNKGQICGDKNGNTAIWFKGPSLFWSSGKGSAFYSPDVVDWFVDNMEIGIIRAAMGIQYYKENSEPLNTADPYGYYYNTNQKAIIKSIIEAAIVNDIYVIVDWHSHNAHNSTETNLAKEFFGELAAEYKDVPNIIWEVYNEPVSADANSIDTYAKAVIKSIRDAGSNNLVIIGSSSWSQKPGSQASQYGTSDKAKTDNVAFVFHFYSGTHSQSGDVGSSATTAMNGGYAVFASEWGFTDANGGGNVGTASDWTSWMDNNKISNCNWSASNIDEASAMFSTSTTPKNLSTSNLTTSGTNFRSYMNSNKWTAQIPSSHPQGKNVNKSVKDGQSVTITAADLGLSTGATVTGVSQPGAGTVSFTGNSITYTSSESGSAEEKVRFMYEITQNSITVKRRVVITLTERRPILPQKAPIAVSRKMETILRTTTNFSATDPSGSKLSFKEVSLSNTSVGTIAIVGANRDSLRFTPAVSMSNTEPVDVTLNYTIQNTNNLSSSANVILKIQNIAPSIICCLGSKPNTGTVGIKTTNLSQDRDKDSLWFVELYLDERYPGRLEQSAKPDSFTYYPDNSKTGTIVFLAVVTDGEANSNVGRTTLTLTGSGTSIGTIQEPTEIPGYNTPIISRPFGNVSDLAIKPLGFGRVELYLAQSGVAKLDVYSLSGKNMGTLLSGYQNSGSREVSLSALNLQKGVYILRLKQGSQVKTLRIAN